jgi:ABC-2 type transport system ATP-binding protein
MGAVTNLEYYARIWKIPAAERHSRIQSLLTTMGLWDRRNEVVGTWSRGMKQKLAVARALLHRPALVFLDEPTAGLDPIAAAALRDDLAALSKDEGVTVFLTTHNLAEAEKLCHQVGVIREGKLLAVGRPDELRRNSSTKVEIFGRNFTPGVLDQLRLRPEVVSAQSVNGHLELNLRPDAETAPLVGLLVQHGVEIEEVRKGKASLEETFLALMENEQGE